MEDRFEEKSGSVKELEEEIGSGIVSLEDDTENNSEEDDDDSKDDEDGKMSEDDEDDDSLEACIIEAPYDSACSNTGS